MSSIVLSTSKKIDKALDVSLAKLNEIHEKVKQSPPSDIRASYNKFWNSLLEKEAETNQIKSELNDSIPYINTCINKTDDILNVIEQFKIDVNNKQVGTLEGTLRQNIKKGNFPAKSLSELHKEVLKQDYNEMKQDTVSGGYYKKTKSKKCKKRKTIKRHFK